MRGDRVLALEFIAPKARLSYYLGVSDLKAKPLEEHPMKAETLLAKLNELRKDASEDEEDTEYLALHHAFCFISYKIADFQQYLNETFKNED